METVIYPKRLIEVDLPIARISAHARREKSIRHGHISTLHIWWARRPLAACRAVICASLWPDPVDLTAWAERGEEIPVGDGSVIIRPRRFLDTARERMTAWAKEKLGKVSQASYPRCVAIQNGAKTLADPLDLQRVLLDFIADFANWDNSTDQDYLATARALTQAAHEALGGEPETRPLVVDPFAGGGSIPLEALRVGADAFASDLNPIPVLLNKVVLKYIPKYGQRLADEVRKWGAWIKQEAEKELAEFYPKDPDGATPIAYLWARTIRCEGPGCGAEVPLIRSLWLAKKSKRSVALRIIPKPQEKRVDFEIIENAKASEERPGTVKRGSATCPCCGYTTPVVRVRSQLKLSHGGADQARLFCVVTLPIGSYIREYRNSLSRDIDAFKAAQDKLDRQKCSLPASELSLIPDEKIPMTEIRRISVPIYGMANWGDLFSARQALALATLVRLLKQAVQRIAVEENRLAVATTTILGLGISRFADICNALCMWETSKTQVRHMFTRQAIGMLWDFAEPNIFADAAGNFAVTLGTMVEVLENQVVGLHTGHVEQASATDHTLPEDSANALFTDPPYYDAVPYAHLSDFFFVWLRRALSDTQ